MPSKTDSADTFSPAPAERTPHAQPALGSFAGVPRVPTPVNDVNRNYLPGSPERTELKARLKQMASERVDIPIVIGGREIRTGRVERTVMPHDHAHVLADWHMAEPQHVHQAIAAAVETRRDWANWAWQDRAAVFLRAAELLATTWRSTLNAATMLGQSKTVFPISAGAVGRFPAIEVKLNGVTA